MRVASEYPPCGQVSFCVKIRESEILYGQKYNLRVKRVEPWCKDNENLGMCNMHIVYYRIF